MCQTRRILFFLYKAPIVISTVHCMVYFLRILLLLQSLDTLKSGLCNKILMIQFAADQTINREFPCPRKP